MWVVPGLGLLGCRLCLLCLLYCGLGLLRLLGGGLTPVAGLLCRSDSALCRLHSRLALGHGLRGCLGRSLSRLGRARARLRLCFCLCLCLRLCLGKLGSGLGQRLPGLGQGLLGLLHFGPGLGQCALQLLEFLLQLLLRRRTCRGCGIGCGIGRCSSLVSLGFVQRFA